MGSKHHEIVPTPLIEKLSLRRGGASAVHKSISNLAKFGLIARIKEAKYDGYRLTYGGLDYLALHTHSARNDVYSVGSRIGVGKESDIMVVADDKGPQRVPHGQVQPRLPAEAPVGILDVPLAPVCHARVRFHARPA